jgi:hypothetical protein
MRVKLSRKRLLLILGILAAIIVAAVFGWKTFATQVPIMKLPQEVSSKLLFTPYLPNELPEGFAMNEASITTNEGALFFSLDSDSARLTFSEQVIPKNYGLDTFYDTAISEPSRLPVHGGTAVYGKSFDQKNTIISYTTTDNTWVIVASTKFMSEDAATKLINSLRAQK